MRAGLVNANPSTIDSISSLRQSHPLSGSFFLFRLRIKLPHTFFHEIVFSKRNFAKFTCEPYLYLYLYLFDIPKKIEKLKIKN